MVAKGEQDMKEKQKKQKEGLSRLIEMAGPKSRKLVAASVLSVISALSRIVFFFTIYGVIRCGNSGNIFSARTYSTV